MLGGIPSPSPESVSSEVADAGTSLFTIFTAASAFVSSHTPYGRPPPGFLIALASSLVFILAGQLYSETCDMPVP